MRLKLHVSLMVILMGSVLLMPASTQERGRAGGPGGGPGGPGGGPGAGGRGRGAPPLQLNTLRMPPGFAIDVYAEGLPAARSLALGAKGTVFVGTFGLLTGQGNIGTVFAVRDTNADGKADQVLTIAQGLNQPNGVAFHNGALYVAEMQRIVRYDGIEDRLSNPPSPVVVKDGFAPSGNHQWRYIAFGPDGKLYIALGAPCNVCTPEESYGTIARMNPDGSAFEVYAHGVRNSVGLAFHPQNGQLWFTDNGRDTLGDNIPSDELNHATEAGQHFGFPVCHQGELLDPEFGKGATCAKYRGPAVKLGPHVAALGLRFYTGTMFPDEYRNELFIAQHGSWNRKNPLGYRIGLVHVHVLVEPEEPARLPHRPRARARRTVRVGPAHLRRRLPAGAPGLGPACRSAAARRRIDARLGRSAGEDLPDHLSRAAVIRQASAVGRYSRRIGSSAVPFSWRIVSA